MKFQFLAVICALSPIAHARLGDTRDQAEARYGLPKSEKAPKYGKPLVEGASELTFVYEGYQIRCALLAATDGRQYIVREEYKKIPHARVLADFEIAAILEGERNGQTWGSPNRSTDLSQGLEKVLQNQFKQTVGDKSWVRPDGATATLELLGLQVRLELPQVAKYEAELKAMKDRQTRAAVPKF